MLFNSPLILSMHTACQKMALQHTLEAVRDKDGICINFSSCNSKTAQSVMKTLIPSMQHTLEAVRDKDGIRINFHNPICQLYLPCCRHCLPDLHEQASAHPRFHGFLVKPA